MTTLPVTASGPWYRERWPWFLMLGPALVLVAGAYTTWLAYSTDDGLIARDYYKRGLLINKTLQLDHNAAAWAISAEGAWSADGRSLSVHVGGIDRVATGLVIRAVVDRTGTEQVIRLRHVGGSWYEAAWVRPTDERWRATLEADDWRLTKMDSGPGAALRFVAAHP